MKRNLGALSLILGVLAPAAYYVLLLIGGLDPSPGESGLLRHAVLATLALALLSAGMAIVALVNGHQRAAASIAICLDLLFLLVFTGLLFTFLRF